MTIETLIQIRNNPYIYNYLRENSSWYKALNRNIDNLKLMEKEIKDYYKLNLSDKLNDLSDKLVLINNIMDIMK